MSRLWLGGFQSCVCLATRCMNLASIKVAVGDSKMENDYVTTTNNKLPLMMVNQLLTALNI